MRRLPEAATPAPASVEALVIELESKMHCPFLEETRVRFCQSAPGTLIPSGDPCRTHERCTSPECVECPTAREVLWGRTSMLRCPLLEETVAQFCAAADARKLIPRNDALLSRCRSEAHRYCALYLRRMHADSEVDVPERLAFAPNHMWVDVAADGTCHVGLDAFFSRVAGSVERVSLMSMGLQRPTAVVTLHGVDLTFVFPNAMLIRDSNVHLRVEPQRLTEDPYGEGWLFAGQDLASRTRDRGASAGAGLRRGAAAAEWMQAETRRMSGFARDVLGARAGGSDGAFAADGGAFAQHLAQQLDRDGLLDLYNRFFTPQRDWSPDSAPEPGTGGGT
jgi:glycine cleavage system H protein